MLSLFGMAWNQSAVHYLSAQGLVQPASVRTFSSLLWLRHAAGRQARRRHCRSSGILPCHRTFVLLLF